MPAVTVIIPFYNRVEWLLQSVESVLAQTFSDFELLLVDDGSDTSPDFLQTFNDPRIRCARQENKGPAAARNLGISLAQGKYIAFLDSDDLFLPDKIEKQFLIMEEHQSVGLSHSSYLRINERGEKIDVVQSGKSSGWLYPEIICGCAIATPTVMIRSKILAELRFDESMMLGEDILLWIQIARVSEILGIDEPLTQVRIHGENAILDPDKQLKVTKYLIRRSFAEDSKITFRLLSRAYSAMYMHQAYLYYKARNIARCSRYLILSLLFRPAGVPLFMNIAYRRALDLADKRSIHD
jgi:glycosyltransferase involved in cell wall biosynthesis